MIGKKIKAIRKTRGLSQQQLADLMQVTRSTISNWECDRRVCSLPEIQELCTLLNVSLDYFAEQKDDVKEMIAKASQVFNDKSIPHEIKADAYKQLMKIYLKADDNENK